MSTSLRGVNLAGAEWEYIPNFTAIENQHYRWVSHQDIDYLAAKGVAFGRLLFSWELLQPALNGPFAATYEASLNDRVDYATGKGMHVMIEPHGGSSANFARYKGNAVGSAQVPNSAFADLWARLAQRHKGNPRVVFGLTNEPNNISTVQWYAAAQAAIDAIRNVAKATNLIMVPGNGFSQPGSWNDTYYDTAAVKVSNATGWATLNDPLGNIAVSVHTYFDTEGGGVDVDDIADLDIIEQRLKTVVTWARARGLKVHLSEFGARAGAQDAPEAVANAIAYMNANADVVIGWAWWTYGPPEFWGGYAYTLCPTNNYTVDNPKMAWLSPHFDAPTDLYIPDNAADTGAEPNNTTTIGWESPNVWVRQSDDGVGVGQAINGGQPCHVYVKVKNRGQWPSTGSSVVRLYWAKASAGLTHPAPWDGSKGIMGGAVDVARPIPPTAKGDARVIGFPWTAPNPVDYGGDGHFCLLACISATGSPQFEGFVGTNLNTNVRNLNDVAWRNIHIVAVGDLVAGGGMDVGQVMAANHTSRDMLAALAFEVLDPRGRRVEPAGGTLLVTPRGAARERFREVLDANRARLEDMGEGAFRVLDPAEGIALRLRPGEVLPLEVNYAPAADEAGFAVRAIQYAVDGSGRVVVGGQTFVAGEVEGFTTPRPARRREPMWPWLLLSALLLLLAALFGSRKKR